MAGYVLLDVDDPGKIFHVDDPDLLGKITSLNQNRNTLIIQVDGDEYAAVLQGLCTYRDKPVFKPRPSDDHQSIAVVANSIGYSMFAHDGRKIDMISGVPGIKLSELEVRLCTMAAMRALNDLEIYQKR